MMVTIVFVWLVVFLVFFWAAQVQNTTAIDKDDQWPPGCVFLFALWPLWILPVLVVIGLKKRNQ
jgi:hypothetical protein